MNATISALNVYPVKSCRGISLQAALLGQTGFTDDRHWMLVRPTGRFVTQRELPRMALIAPQLDGATLRLHAPGQTPLTVAREAAGERRDVTVWKFDGHGIDCGDDAAQWLSRFLETELRLVRFDPDHPRRCAPEWTPGATAVTEFSDGFPILVISRASLAELNSRLPLPLPMERFRPNIVVEGLDAYDEDRVHELRGNGLAIRIVKPCTRCSITTTDQQKGERDGVEPLQTLKTFRFDSSLHGVAFGQNAIPIDGVGQTLSVGQPLEVIWK